MERAGYIEAPRDPDLAFEFLQPVKRQIRHDGVEYKGRIYNGPGLNGLRGTRALVLVERGVATTSMSTQTTSTAPTSAVRGPENRARRCGEMRQRISR